MAGKGPHSDAESPDNLSSSDPDAQIEKVSPGQQSKDYCDGSVKGGKNLKKNKEDKKVAQLVVALKYVWKKYTPGAPPGETPGQTLVICLVLAAAVCLVAVILSHSLSLYVGPAEPEIKSDQDFDKIYENTLGSLQFIFTNQTDRFWRILKNRGLAHLRNTNPRKPLVFLLAAPPAAHSIVDCLATKLAQELDAKHNRNLALVDGAKEKFKQGEKVKKDMDELLIEKFQNGHRAALIRHLELLPPPSPLLFYSYCDDQNAPHKRVAIIFTVHLPEEPDLSLPAKEAEGAVEKYLANQVWAKEDQDSVAALLSRVADTVALMNGETSESVQSFCNNIENYKFSK